MRTVLLLCCLFAFSAQASVTPVERSALSSPPVHETAAHSCPAHPTPPQYVMMSCLENAQSIEQGYLVGDDGKTKIGVLRLTDAPIECRTNMLSHPFVIELMRAGTMKESIWFNSQSVDAVLKGDGWVQRINVLDVAKGDVFLHRTDNEVDSVGLVKDVVDKGNSSVWIVFEFKTDGNKEKTGSILLERNNPDGLEIWSPKPNKK